MPLKAAVATGATGRTLGVFTRYGELGASSRLRILPYLPLVSTLFDSVTVHRLLDDTYLRQLYDQNRRNTSQVCMSYLRRGIDAVRNRGFAWIEKELFPFLPSWIERLLMSCSRTVVLDYDDAVFHTYDMNNSPIVRALLRRKIDRLMARADLVVAGNRYLAERALLAGCKRVEVVPTVIDLERYPAIQRSDTSRGAPLIGWIGYPGSQRYLQQIQIPLAKLLDSKVLQVELVGATPQAAWRKTCG